MPRPRPIAPISPEQARRRQVIAGVVALVVLVAIAVGIKSAGDSEADQAPAPTTAAETVPATSSSPATQLPTKPKATTRTLPSYRSTGTFSRVATGTPVRGRAGQVMTYRVEVERGSGVSTRAFAHEVDETLSHRRGWTAGGHWRFQRVVRSTPELTIRLATPKTVDEACAAAGADTDGYTSCRAGQMIWLNLDRWYIGVPHVKDLEAYRHYLINHEVGHGLGKGHESCPAKGRPAPVMLQQTLGLDGCVANAWPRTAGGRMISGPASE